MTTTYRIPAMMKCDGPAHRFVSDPECHVTVLTTAEAEVNGKGKVVITEGASAPGWSQHSLHGDLCPKCTSEELKRESSLRLKKEADALLNRPKAVDRRPEGPIYHTTINGGPSHPYRRACANSDTHDCPTPEGCERGKLCPYPSVAKAE